MPTITNFGDVVTVGNAAVNGTGTSSFAGPVTFAQGVSITGSVSTSSAFYGTLAGLNTASVSTLTASTNVYAPIVTTPVSNAVTAIATTGFYGAIVGSNTASVTVLTASTNVNAPVINVSSLNVSSQANVTTLNVSGFATLFQANVLTANVTSLNVSTRANVTTLNVSGFTTLNNANVLTANVTSLNVSTQANVTSLNVSSFASFTFANVLTANITSGNVLTANISTLNVSGFTSLSNANVLTANVTSLNVSTQANVTTLNVSGFTTLSNANVLTANVTSLNVSTRANVTTLNVSGFTTLSNANVLTANVTSLNVSTQANVTTLNVSSFASFTFANVLTSNITSGNVLTANVTTLNVSGFTTLFQANVLTANVTSLNVSTQANVTFLNVSSSAFLSNANVLTANISTANIVSLNVTGDANVTNITVGSNLYTSNIIMSSNLSTNTGYGNVYLTGNLVVAGNIYSVGGSVGSGSGTSQGVLYSLGGAGYPLGSPFITGSAGPAIAGYHINLSSFNPEAVASVSAFSAASGMLKFATGGLYQVTCVIVGDQPIVKLAFGKTSSSSFAALPTGSTAATSGYDYVYNFPLNSSPSTVITIPLTVQDTSQYYYLDAFFSTAAGTPTTLYPTRSTTAVGSAYGTYVQVGPFGNYLTSATGVASGLLMNAYGTTTLSAPVTSNTFRLAMTSSNGWTVSGVSTALTVTSGGNFQVNQVGIYEVSMCLNTSVTPMMFGVGSLASDTAPGTQGPYIYQYAPMYTQDPTTIVTMPLNITDTSKYYYLDVIFPGTQSTVALSNVSTFVSLKPVGSYVSPSTNPWSQQGSSVYYTGGAVGIGGVNPSLLTETFTVNGNTSFVGNVTVTSDASSNNYVLARRTPAGSLDVTQYVTGSVPLTTTTNLIQRYLSNAAAVVTSAPTYNPALSLPGTVNSGVLFQNGGHSANFSNLALSNIFVEAWIYRTSAAAGAIFERAVGSGTDIVFYVGAGSPGALNAYLNNTSGAQIGSSTHGTTIGLNGWVHVAFSYNRTSATAGQPYLFVNGIAATGTAVATQPRLQPTANIYIGYDVAGPTPFAGYIADVRVMTGCIVPVGNFTAQSPPFTTAPVYRTGMDTGYTSNLTLALQSQYFPGASTSPYGPVLTLPGTVGSYYTEVNSGQNINWKTNGFCCEMWVNYASFASANGYYISSSSPYSMGLYFPVAAAEYDWGFGALSGGQVGLYWINSTFPYSLNTAPATLTTGTWNHIMVQCNGSNAYIAVNGTFLPLSGYGYTPAGNGTVAPNVSSVVTVTAGVPITVGPFGGQLGPNFAIAKARLTFGTSGSPSLGNVYSSGNFTANPNFAAVPAGATVAWQLESQYPLPTYPSFFDVPQLPQQIAAYGAEPVPVGGVTSNVLSPYSTTYPQLDSIRFDGTGYIDYGNAASSALTTNIWANAWTIEGWVYPTSFSGGTPAVVSYRNPTTATVRDWEFGLDSGGRVYFQYNSGVGYAGGSATPLPLNTWSHIAATYDGVRTNVYSSVTLTSTPSTPSAANMVFNPTSLLTVGFTYNTYFQGNLADVRVSNVARYTGSTYTVPTAPFATDSSTLLLLKSLGGQVGTTLEVQGRGLNATSLGAGRVIQSYPPAPMSSYLLDTTSNASVTYGQGKYVASASSEYAGGAYPIWGAFDKTTSWTGTPSVNPFWSSVAVYANGGSYYGSNVTVDVTGSSYVGEWLQLQMPVSVILSNYVIWVRSDYPYQPPTKFWILGSRDGVNWTLVNSQSGLTWASPWNLTFSVGATQAYNFYRLVVNTTYNLSGGNPVSILEWTLNGTEESLCVTSDSKVGVGIANPQRALEVAGDLVVSGTVSMGNPISFRNRIINGDMRIAQRGTINAFTTSGGVGTSAYLIDRFLIQWLSTDGSVSVTQQTLAVSDTPYQYGIRNSHRCTVNVPLAVGASTYFLPGQNIEGHNITDLNWGTSFGSPATLSFWFRSNVQTGRTFPIAIRNSATTASYVSPFSIVSSGTWQYVTLTFPPPPNGTAWNSGTSSTGITLAIGGWSVPITTSTVNTWLSGSFLNSTSTVNWLLNAGNYIEFTGVQLEKGTVATPFEFRPFATELALCYRYYQKSYQYSDVPASATLVSMVTATGLDTSNISGTRFMVDLRTAPGSCLLYAANGTVNKGNAWGAASAGSLVPPTGGTLTATELTQKGFRYATSTSTITVGNPYMYHYIADAEL